jgi:hypothetical protein
MPTWKCKYFSEKENDGFYWNKAVENCGLCVNWCEDKCLHHDRLKELGEENLRWDDDFGFSRVNTEWNEW